MIIHTSLPKFTDRESQLPETFHLQIVVKLMNNYSRKIKIHQHKHQNNLVQDGLLLI